MFYEVCAELGGTVQPGSVLTSMSHAPAAVLAVLLQTGKYSSLSPSQHLAGHSCPQSSRSSAMLLLGKDVAMRHIHM